MKILHAGTQTIHTERLLLRRFEPEDARSMFANWIHDEDVQGNYGEPACADLESVASLLRVWLECYEKRDYYRWAIILKGGNENIGQIAFCRYDERHNFADIEYCIGKAFQNKGYASEALAAVIRFTFENTGINRLQAFHRGRNAPSGRVLAKSPMRYEGTLRQSYRYGNGAYDDRIYYGITREEYLAAAGGKHIGPRR